SFRSDLLDYEPPRRPSGQSNYALGKMFKLALNATLSFSGTPVRLAVQVGFLTIAVSLMYLGYIVLCLFTGKTLVPGWTSMIFLTTFLGGVQLAFIGLLGEYITRIFEEVKQRPLYVLKQRPAAS